MKFAVEMQICRSEKLAVISSVIYWLARTIIGDRVNRGSAQIVFTVNENCLPVYFSMNENLGKAGSSENQIKAMLLNLTLLHPKP
jgi:hypothetical protein